MFKVVTNCRPPPLPCGRVGEAARSVNCLNAKALMIGSAALFSLSSCPRLHPEPRDPEHPRADTRRVVAPTPPRPPSPAGADFGGFDFVETCVCLHALSSFQRTDRPPRFPATRPLSSVRQGNPERLLPRSTVSSPYFSGRIRSTRGRPNRSFVWGTLQAY